MPRPFDAVIFDCDGTLVDSEPPGFAGILAAAREIGLEFASAQALLHLKGKRMRETLQALEQALGRPLPEGFEATLRRHMADQFERHLKPIKHAFDARCRQRKTEELDKLRTLEARHFEQLQLDFAGGIEQVNAARRKQRETDTEELFKSYQDWVRETLELDDRAQYAVVAVLVGCTA